MGNRDARAGRSLFTCTTAGGTWELAVLLDGGCALLLDGDVATSGDASPASVRRVVDAFLRVATIRGNAGPRIPPPAAGGYAAHGWSHGPPGA